MTEGRVSEDIELVGGLRVRGLVMISEEEVAALQAQIGDELLVSSTLRAWFEGDETLTPHSVGVALEAQLRMLFGEPAPVCELLVRILDRLAEAFPADVQPLDTA